MFPADQEPNKIDFTRKGPRNPLSVHSRLSKNQINSQFGLKKKKKRLETGIRFAKWG